MLDCAVFQAMLDKERQLAAHIETLKKEIEVCVYCVVLCCVVLCYAVLYCAALCCVVLWCVVVCAY